MFLYIIEFIMILLNWDNITLIFDDLLLYLKINVFLFL